MGFMVPYRAGERAVFLKLGARKSLSIAKVSVTVLLEATHERIDQIAIALGAVALTVVRAARGPRVPRRDRRRVLQRFAQGREGVLDGGRRAEFVRPADKSEALKRFRHGMTGIARKRHWLLSELDKRSGRIVDSHLRSSSPICGPACPT